MNNLTNVIINQAQMFQALNNKKPTLIIGKQTIRLLDNIDIKAIDDIQKEDCVTNIYGYEFEIGDFDCGFIIK